MLLGYNDFKNKNVFESSVIDQVGNSNIDKLIDKAYKYFKNIKKPVNTLDIMEYVETLVGKEMSDDDYEELYYKITGEDFDGDEIYDLEEEEKFIVK